MIFMRLRDESTGEERSRLFYSWDAAHRASFSPVIDTVFCTSFKIKGRSYAERKEAARELAIDVQYNDVGGLSWGEWGDICDFFYKIGRRYGLLREFRENCIC